jgi:hypothetical protein
MSRNLKYPEIISVAVKFFCVMDYGWYNEKGIRVMWSKYLNQSFLEVWDLRG